jgi:hypothetical protein
MLAYHDYSLEDSNKNKQNLILISFLKVINMAIITATSLKHWKTVHSIVLFIDKTIKFLHCIRNIHIYEADYNLILKQKWGKAIN